ncbi:MAG TPA: BlaI/MecI/CopY family transcriptional regulator [Candidatus Avipropionibacterium avicola]|uniref:BlaI/MecI/CopY family transcriptional regulator n=1 Tax=Candidatus Avipropionibacterium avicola TaxID=2840701 RepID=A0A9D1GZT9_9ACTN|nr:BlaI/MecI/CopY family transcriptional regulator [Candidatus Avipropionibacterium avicola]
MAGLGELERSVMDVLWASSEPLSVRQVHAALSDDRDLAYTTVMTVLVRLSGKGLAARELDGRAWLYTAAQAREELTAEAMHSALNDDPEDRSAALVAFVEKVSPDEAEMLRKALADLEQTPDPGRPRKRRAAS